MPAAVAPSPDLITSPAQAWRTRAFAGLRIAFGVVWSIDAAYKWVPAFRTQTLQTQFAHHLAEIHTPVIHQWISFWDRVAVSHSGPFGFTIAVVETLLAIGLLTGFFSRLTFAVGAVFSAGIWTAAEGMGLPIQAGQTDIGTSCIYVLVYAALFIGAAGSAWSADAWLRSRGRSLSFRRGSRPRPAPAASDM
jgi:nitrite reductase (NO-forming)